MKFEKEVYINDYEFNCFDDGLKYDIVEFYKENYFTDEEREFIIKNCGEKLKLTLEVKEPILDDVERKYLSGVIRPFRNIVKGISKMKSVSKENMEYILITLADTECSYMAFPYFKKEKMYKNMELNKEYTLEELGL